MRGVCLQLEAVDRLEDFMDSEHLGESLGRPWKEVGVEQAVNIDELTALGKQKRGERRQRMATPVCSGIGL